MGIIFGELLKNKKRWRFIMPEIRTREVLQSVLIQVLNRFPDGISLHSAYEEIERHFSFPQEWLREIPASTGYDELEKRGLNWHNIPQEQLIQLVPTEPQWQNEIRWARNELRKVGYLDMTVPRGIWKLTDAGKQAAEPIMKALTPAEKIIATSKPKKQENVLKLPKIIESGLSSRDMLERKLQLLTSSMPIGDLELLVDIARSIRLRSVDI
jgi:restriction endonuclease Mrr